MIYLATPLGNTKAKVFAFDEKKMWDNLALCEKLEASGFKIFLPQRDVDQSLPGKELLEIELQTIRDCDCLVARLSDTRGVYIECGYAKALGKKVIGIKVEGMRELGDFGKAFFDAVVETPDELIECLRKLKIQKPL